MEQPTPPLPPETPAQPAWRRLARPAALGLAGLGLITALAFAALQPQSPQLVADGFLEAARQICARNLSNEPIMAPRYCACEGQILRDAWGGVEPLAAEITRRDLGQSGNIEPLVLARFASAEEFAIAVAGCVRLRP